MAKSSHDVAIDEKEVDQWLFECDHFVSQNLMSFIVMTFMAGIFLEKDVTFVVSFLLLASYFSDSSYSSFSLVVHSVDLL